MAYQQRPNTPSRLGGMLNMLGEVLPCHCGGVRLSLGAVTLHFTAEEVGQLRDLVAAAAELAAVVPPAREKRPQTRRLRRVRPSTTLH